MLFSRQLPTKALIEFCRNLRHLLGAGLTLPRIVRQQASRGNSPLRPVAERLADHLEEGESLEAALDRERSHFPALFLEMAAVGEETGNLAEVMGELEKYYVRQDRLWRQFLSQITLPVFQFVGAVLVIAGLLLVLGFIADMNNGSAPFTPLGFSPGVGGAISFLCTVGFTLGGALAAYLILTRTLKQAAVVHSFLLSVPAIGPCLTAFAMMRLCMALHLTMETALPLRKGLKLALRATGNAAFTAKIEQVQHSLRTGDDLTEVLGKTGLFSTEFISIVEVAEESGRLPEVMRHQTEHYEEEAGRRLTVLTKVAGWLVWLMVAGFIITAIFQIFGQYTSQLNQLAG